MVPKKLGDKLWNDFLTACNHFFDARNSANAGTRNEERANLENKRSIIEKLKALAEGTEDNIQEKVRNLVDEYNAIGHVPFKEKTSSTKSITTYSTNSIRSLTSRQHAAAWTSSGIT